MSLMRAEIDEAPAVVTRVLANLPAIETVAARIRALAPAFVTLAARGSSSHPGRTTGLLTPRRPTAETAEREGVRCGRSNRTATGCTPGKGQEAAAAMPAYTDST